MKTNLPYSFESNDRSNANCVAAKSHATTPLLLFMALALVGCEGLDSGSSGTSSPWPAAATGHSTSQTGFASGLSGQWYHDGKPTSISVAPDGRNLTIIDENGRRTSGVANSPYELQFGGLIGSVGHGGRRISWNNGTTWTREPHQGGSHFGPAPDQGISGRWYHDGKPTSVSVTGRAVTITNEAGQSSSGSLAGNEIAIFGGPSGRISDGGRRISWSNGTTWSR
jgi:hypothetical protein